MRTHHKKHTQSTVFSFIEDLYVGFTAGSAVGGLIALAGLYTEFWAGDLPLFAGLGFGALSGGIICMIINLVKHHQHSNDELPTTSLATGLKPDNDD